jgi:NAD+ diphosphatase
MQELRLRGGGQKHNLSAMQPFELVKFCPRCGQPAAVKPAAIPFRCNSCGLELYFNSTVSVSAFIFQEDGQVLLIRRAKEPGRGLLATIGGFVDIGETAEAALRREIREEVHLEITRMEYLTSAPNEYTYAGVTYPVLDLFFVCWTAASDTAQTSAEVLSLVRQKISDIQPQSMAFDSMRQAMLILKSNHAG